MNDSGQYIDDFLVEMDDRVYQQEDELYNQFEDFFYDFDTDNSILKQSADNFSRANKVNDEFAQAFAAYLAGFLIWYGNKVIGVQPFVVNRFNDMGLKANLSDVDFLKKQIGIDGATIIKDSYLWNLGFMGEFRQKVQNYIINSIASAKRFNAFLRDAKPLFKSTTEQPSGVMNFYRKYAYDTANQMLNVTGNFFADKFGLDTFLYEGGLIKDSREFCIERAGNTYTKQEGESWNELQWSGKIPGVDFFIQCGGFRCRHNIQWINNI